MSNDITPENAAEQMTVMKEVIGIIGEHHDALTPELIEEGKFLLEGLNAARSGLAQQLDLLVETLAAAAKRPLLGSQVMWYHEQDGNLTPYLGIITAIEKDATGAAATGVVEVNVLGYRRPLEYTRCAIGTEPGDNVAVFFALPNT